MKFLSKKDLVKVGLLTGLVLGAQLGLDGFWRGNAAVPIRGGRLCIQRLSDVLDRMLPWLLIFFMSGRVHPLHDVDELLLKVAERSGG